MEEIKRLSLKKISESEWGEYIKCCLHADVVEKLKELFDYLEDEKEYVSTR